MLDEGSLSHKSEPCVERSLSDEGTPSFDDPNESERSVLSISEELGPTSKFGQQFGVWPRRPLHTR